MLKRIILVGCFILVSLNISANEADLAKEAKQYKNLKDLCLKVKEESPYARSRIMLRWKKGNCYFRRAKKELKPFYDKYNSLAPYVFSNMKPGNKFLKLDGFTKYRYKENDDGGYTIRFGKSGIKKDELNELYANFYKKYKKIDFKTEKEVRGIEESKESIRKTYEIMYMASGGITEEGKKKLNEDLRNAIPRTLTWDTTTFKNKNDTLIFKVRSILTSKETEISGNIEYIVN